MKNIYQTIKQNVRKYVLSTMAVGSVILGFYIESCIKDNAKYLPLTDKSREIVLAEQQIEKQNYLNAKTKELDSLVLVANYYVKKAKSNFNKSVQKRNLDSLTLENVYKNYEKAEQNYKKANKCLLDIAREKAEPNTFPVSRNKYNLSGYNKKLMRKIKHTLHGIDFGKSEIQKDLKKQGLEVEVYNNPNIEKGFAQMISFMGLILGPIVYLIFKRLKK